MKTKNTIKLLNSITNIFKLAIELEKKQTELNINEVKNIFYEGGFRSGRTHFYEQWSKQLNEYLREKGLNDSQPFGFAPIVPTEKEALEAMIRDLEKNGWVVADGKNTSIKDYLNRNKENHSHSFYRRMLEANKELQKVCENIEKDCKCLAGDFIETLYSFEYNAKSCRHKKCFGCGKITVTHRYNT